MAMAAVATRALLMKRPCRMWFSLSCVVLVGLA